MFVDSLLTVQTLEAGETRQIEAGLHAEDPQRVLTAAADLLSNLSSFAGVVMTPRRSSVFRQVEFVRLSARRLLLIIVTQEGGVQNRILQVDRDYSPSELVEAANYINQHFAGHTFDQVQRRLGVELATLRDDITSLMQRAVQATGQAVSENNDPVVFAGERNLLSISDLSDNMERLRRLFDLFQQRTALTQLLDASIRGAGVQIYIGGESELVPMDHLSVVVAPYEVDGRVVGTLGVVGPTRMAYDRVIPIVDITAKLVSSTLSQG